MRFRRAPRPGVSLLMLLALAACNAEPTAMTDEAGADALRQRLLPMSGTSNARDMGGYTTADGRTVKWGVLFRADSLANLTDADVVYLDKLRLRAVTDFRGASERDGAPDRLPESSPPVAYRAVPITNPAVDVAELGRKVYAGKLTEDELLALLDRKGYVNDPDIARMWGQWVQSLAEPGQLPQLFHCTAGKDRTGFAAALVLLTLGVREDEVMRDFLQSNDFLASQIEAGIVKISAHADIDPEVMRQVLGVSPASLEGAIEAMVASYGSVDAFIEQGLGIDAATRSRLQDLLLEKKGV